MNKLKHLFQPIKIGQMEVKNRIVMPPMGVVVTDENRNVTPQLIEYFVERARSEPGMICVQGSQIQPSGETDRGGICLWDDKWIPGMRDLVNAVHKYDVKFGIEIQHGGVQSDLEEVEGPSAVSALAVIRVPVREMSKDDIKECIKNYGRGAERCVKAGFDFVEIHGCHGYLVTEFLCPYFNRRTDEYGGSFDNRIRFITEVVREMKSKIGKVPLGLRVNGDDFIKDGWTLDETCRLIPILEKEGLDYVSVSFGVYGADRMTIPSMYEEQGVFAYLAEAVKKHVSIPVITVGRLKDPVMADRIIKEGKADLVAMGRAQIADPELASKAREGKLADIRPCIADCMGCIEEVWRQAKAGGWPTGASCTVNPRVGREWVIKDIKDEKKANAKKVLVVGGGCAGLEAARSAAFVGHEVILCESKGKLGGQLRLAAMIPRRQELEEILPWYERELNKLGVEIRLNTTVDEKFLEQIGPDVVVLATGSLPEVPLGYIQGLENVKEIELLMVDELIEEKKLTGDNVLVIGIDQVGLQVADYLVEQGKNVYAMGKEQHFGEKMAGNDKFYLIGGLIKKGVKRGKNIQRIEILPTDEVWVVSEGGKEKLPEIDTIVFASDRRPNIFLEEIITKKGIESRIIGEASGIADISQGTAYACIAAGYDAGRQI